MSHTVLVLVVQTTTYQNDPRCSAFQRTKADRVGDKYSAADGRIRLQSAMLQMSQNLVVWRDIIISVADCQRLSARLYAVSLPLWESNALKSTLSESEYGRSQVFHIFALPPNAKLWRRAPGDPK